MNHTTLSNASDNLNQMKVMGKCRDKVQKLQRELKLALDEINPEKDHYETYLENLIVSANHKLQEEVGSLTDSFQRREERLRREIDDLKEAHDRKVRLAKEANIKTVQYCNTKLLEVKDKKYNSLKIRRIKADLALSEVECEEKRAMYFGDATVIKEAEAPTYQADEEEEEEEEAPPCPVVVRRDSKGKRVAKSCMIDDTETTEIIVDRVQLPTKASVNRFKVRTDPVENTSLKAVPQGFPPRCPIDMFAKKLQDGDFGYMKAVRDASVLKECYGFTQDEVLLRQSQMFAETD